MMIGGSSVLSSAILEFSETSVSCSGKEVSLTPNSLLPLRMREHLRVCKDEGEACASKLTLKLCNLSRVCLNWRNFGHLDVLGMEAHAD